jgi:hypothetical protein
VVVCVCVCVCVCVHTVENVKQCKNQAAPSLPTEVSVGLRLVTNGEATLTRFGCDGWQSEWSVSGIERVYTATVILFAYLTGGLQIWTHCGLKCESALKSSTCTFIDLNSRRSI